MKLAPIALFVYNRPVELRKVLSSLKNNKDIKNTEIYIFSDGPKKNKLDIQKVNNVRKILNKVKDLKIKKKFFYKKNRGLKKNIINGVNYVFKTHSKIIVLEDDLLTSPSFIRYMNQSLNYIKDKKNIWHVSAWNYPIKMKKVDSTDTFLWNHMNCWGWGTHKKYWKKLILDPNFFIKKFSKEQIFQFDLGGKLNNWSQLVRNYEKKLNTWAIFWGATIFWNKALCVNPIRSYVKNIGTNTNSTHTLNFIAQTNKLNEKIQINFPKRLKNNISVTNKIKSHLFLRNKIDIFKNLIKKL